MYKFVRIWPIFARFTSKHIQVKWVWADFHVRRKSRCRWRDSYVRWLPRKKLMFLFFFFLMPSFDSVAVERQETSMREWVDMQLSGYKSDLNTGSFVCAWGTRFTNWATRVPRDKRSGWTFKRSKAQERRILLIRHRGIFRRVLVAMKPNIYLTRLEGNLQLCLTPTISWG